MARGVAYARRPYPYLLNVPARRMSADAAEPAGFLTFARERLHDAGSEDFLPRELYGDYLEASLRSAESERPCHVELERARGQAVEIERFHRTAAVCVHLADGRNAVAGSGSAAGIPGTWRIRGRHRRSCARASRCWWLAPDLTAADTFLAGNHAARGDVLFHAISRHRLLPPPQTPFQRNKYEISEPSALLRAAAGSLPRLVRAVRALAADLEARGGDWRQAIAFVREITPALWQQLSIAERRRFLRHVRSHWDVHRHRLPDSVWQTLHNMRKSGRLRIDAGRVVAVHRAGSRVRVTWRARSSPVSVPAGRSGH